MHLEVISPSKKVFDEQVKQVTFPGEDGLFQVLENHAPMIASLKKGDVNIKGDDIDTIFKISSGIVEIKKNKVIVLVESIIEE